MPATSTPQPPTAAPGAVWHALPVEEVATRLEVDLATGLSADEARARLEAWGPNRLRATPPAALVANPF